MKNVVAPFHTFFSRVHTTQLFPRYELHKTGITKLNFANFKACVVTIFDKIQTVIFNKKLNKKIKIQTVYLICDKIQTVYLIVDKIQTVYLNFILWRP